MISENRVKTSQAFLDVLPRVNLGDTFLKYTSKIVNLGLYIIRTSLGQSGMVHLHEYVQLYSRYVFIEGHSHIL